MIISTKTLFWAAAILNFTFAGALFAPEFFIGTIFGAQHLATELIGQLWQTAAVWLVVCFGLIFVAIAMNLEKGRPFMLVSAIAKIGVFLFAISYWRDGTISTLLFSVTVLDLVLGVLFLRAFLKAE